MFLRWVAKGQDFSFQREAFLIIDCHKNKYIEYNLVALRNSNGTGIKAYEL